MDRKTQATLWIAALTILLYVIWFVFDCRRDEACHPVWCGPYRLCGISRKPPPSSSLGTWFAIADMRR
jgi:hypothetical protein